MARSEQVKFSKLIRGTSNIDFLGHLTQVLQNLQSSKHFSPTILQDFLPAPETPKVHSRNVMSIFIPSSAKELSYCNITRSIPFKSSRGNQYVYVLCDYDSNTILVEPMKTRQAQKIATTWTKLYKRLYKHGHKISHFILDSVQRS